MNYKLYIYIMESFHFDEFYTYFIRKQWSGFE